MGVLIILSYTLAAAIGMMIGSYIGRKDGYDQGLKDGREQEYFRNKKSK